MRRKVDDGIDDVAVDELTPPDTINKEVAANGIRRKVYDFPQYRGFQARESDGGAIDDDLASRPVERRRVRSRTAEHTSD